MTAAAAALLVATAVSIRGPIETAAAEFARTVPGEEITLQGASSGALVAQIEQGAPYGVFVSASASEMDRLAGAGRLVAGSRVQLATNRLVVVVRRDLQAPARIEDLVEPRFARIAAGNPKTVPAGRYADQALHAAHVLPAASDRVIYGENAAQVLDYVARGEADAGLVYATDAKRAGSAIVNGPEAPPRGHDPIVYEGAAIAGAAGVDRGRAFLAFLASPAGRAILERGGFGPPPSP